MEESRRLHLSLFLLRLLGGFPYQRREKNDYMKTVTQVYAQMHTSEARRRLALSEGPPHYQDKSVWRAWTWCVALILVCYVGVVVFDVPLIQYRYTTWPKTLMVANKVREIITSLAVLVMEVYVLTSSSSALKTANQYLDLLPVSKRHSATLLTDVLVVVSGVLFLTGNCIVLTSYVFYLTYNGICGYIFFVITQYVETILYLLINCFVITYLYTMILLFCDVLQGIRKQLVETCSKWESRKNVTQQKPVLKMCGRDACSVQPQDLETNDTRNIKANEAREDLTRIAKDSQRTLTQLHFLHYSLNRYLGLPITLIMLTSVVYSILACFYLSYLYYMTNAMRVMSMSYFIIAVLPQFLLSNLPVLLQTQEEELRIQIRFLLHQEDDAVIKNELREVLEVVDEAPGFQLCRVFTLSRARMLDILSFMATYLIILLQFSSTEDWDDEGRADHNLSTSFHTTT